MRTTLGTGMRAGELQGLMWKDIDFKNREIHVNKTLVYVRDKHTKKYVFKFQVPKTKSSICTIPMQDDVYKALQRQRWQITEMKLRAKKWKVEPEFEDLVFLTITGNLRRSNDFLNDLERIREAINKDRRREAEKAGRELELMEHFYPYSLRHTFATRCFETGIDAKTVQNYLGHTSIAITMDLYTYVTEQKARTEMEKLNQLYKKIG